MLAALLCAGVLTIHGAGATSAQPLFARWFTEYARTHADVQVQYAPVGSGEGVRRVLANEADFGASDVPLSDAEVKAAPDVLHVPATISVIAVATSLPQPRELQLTAELLAAIFLGHITNWSDARLAHSAPALPDLPITVVHRADSSGSTRVLTDYLGTAPTLWHGPPGLTAQFPVGVAVTGSDSMAETIARTPGAIGYLDLGRAHVRNLQVARLQNAAGQFVAPRLDTASTAALKAQVRDDFRLTLTNAPGRASYPLATFTFLLVRREKLREPLASFVQWALGPGQAFAAGLDFAPLPTPLVQRLQARLRP